jgi:two-component system chemotaxis response regulator CheY
MAKVIMTADDSASIRQMMSFSLKQNGYEVIEAVDGQDALTKLASQKVDMLLTDLNMPNLDGIGLIKGVRAGSLNKFIPIIMVTTESVDSKKAEGKAAGATGWIVKPFRPDQLIAVIKKVLG